MISVPQEDNSSTNKYIDYKKNITINVPPPLPSPARRLHHEYASRLFTSPLRKSNGARGRNLINELKPPSAFSISSNNNDVPKLPIADQGPSITPGTPGRKKARKTSATTETASHHTPPRNNQRTPKKLEAKHFATTTPKRLRHRSNSNSINYSLSCASTPTKKTSSNTPRKLNQTAGASPYSTPIRRNRKKLNCYSDRFIPSRDQNDLQLHFSLLQQSPMKNTSRTSITGVCNSINIQSESNIPSNGTSGSVSNSTSNADGSTDNTYNNIASTSAHVSSTDSRRHSVGAGHSNTMVGIIDRRDTLSQDEAIADNTREVSQTYAMLLKSELLGVNMGSSTSQADKSIRDDKITNTTPSRNLFQYNRSSIVDEMDHFASPTTSSALRTRVGYTSSSNAVLGLSPVGSATHKMLNSPAKVKRKIAKVPFKVLDAPSLQDDFYLNLVDWSALNVLAVGLGSCVYLWSACTSKVTKLCDMGSDSVTSVSWTQRGTHLAVGCSNGELQIWDTVKCKRIRVMGGHSARIGTMAWCMGSLASGSRDRTILIRDVRASESYTSKLIGHKQEVCGLKWSFDDQQLASGGNDNKLLIWNASSSTPILKFSEHTAAVKAIAWSPHQHGLLATGGGTADRCIRFWNTMSGSALNCIDTGSQVCNLMWSKNINEVVSTHGYSLNQIIVWKYPTMTKVATLTGHTYRVLYLAMSPDGQTIVTGAGDETLRFWNVFPGAKHRGGSTLGSSVLFPSVSDLR